MRRLAAAASLAALLAAGCGDSGGSEPPTILYGEDICDHCRMVISERRHAAAAMIDGRERRFDDPDCLRQHLEAEPVEAADAWVHDETTSWRRVEEAWFVTDPEGGTPMASGLLAYGSLAAATAAGERYGSEPRRWRDGAAGRAGAAE